MTISEIDFQNNQTLQENLYPLSPKNLVKGVAWALACVPVTIATICLGYATASLGVFSFSGLIVCAIDENLVGTIVTAGGCAVALLGAKVTQIAIALNLK